MTTTTNKTTATESDSVRQRLRDVGLYGLAAQDHALLRTVRASGTVYCHKVASSWRQR